MLKHWMKYVFFALILLMEITIIVFIGKNLIGRFFSVAVVDKKAIKKTALKKYKYFYENSTDTEISVQPDWAKKKVTYVHNKDGLNTTRDYQEKKKQNIIRIAAVGDSFTYGLYVDTWNNWSSLLEKKLNAQECGYHTFEVLNFGVPGYDIDYSIQRNKIRAEKYNSDIFLWFIKNDDFTDAKELLMPIEKRMLNGQKYTIGLYNKVLEVLFTSHNKQTIAAEQQNQLEQYINENPEKTFIFVLPKGNIDYPAIDKKYSIFMESLKKKYKSVDILQIELNRGYTFAPVDHHFNAKGNEFFATIMTRYLTKQYCL